MKSIIRLIFNSGLIFIAVMMPYTAQANDTTKKHPKKKPPKGTITLPITSHNTHREYELYIQLPANYEVTEKSYPVVILQDIGVTFSATQKAVKSMAGKEINDVILVGMSYEIGTPPKISRTRDFTPTYAPNEKGGHSLAAQKYSGKADEYITFISQDVMPLLLNNYRIDKENTTFIGHSFGGLLGAYILLVQPELFVNYIISSPSLWYDNKAIFQLEQAYAKQNKSMNAQVLMYIGSEESKSRRGNMVQHLIDYQKTLTTRSYKGLEVSAKVLKGENHASTFAALLPSALKHFIPHPSNAL